MNGKSIRTGRDIAIEVNGARVAVVESYRARTSRSVYEVEELGSELPAGTVGGRVRYELTLKRVHLLGGDGPDFHSLKNFDVVIISPGGRVVYSGCEWAEIDEGVSAGEPCAETILLTAGRRVCL